MLKRQARVILAVVVIAALVLVVTVGVPALTDHFIPDPMAHDSSALTRDRHLSRQQVSALGEVLGLKGVAEASSLHALLSEDPTNFTLYLRLQMPAERWQSIMRETWIATSQHRRADAADFALAQAIRDNVKWWDPEPVYASETELSSAAQSDYLEDEVALIREGPTGYTVFIVCGGLSKNVPAHVLDSLRGRLVPERSFLPSHEQVFDTTWP